MPASLLGDDESALVRLWREKRGEVEPQDLSGNLVVQLGIIELLSTSSNREKLGIDAVCCSDTGCTGAIRLEPN